MKIVLIGITLFPAYCLIKDESREAVEGTGNKSKRDNATKLLCQSQTLSVPSQDSSSRIPVQ